LKWLGDQAYLSTSEERAHWSSVLRNQIQSCEARVQWSITLRIQMWIKRLRDKTVKVLRTLWAIYTSSNLQWLLWRWLHWVIHCGGVYTTNDYFFITYTLSQNKADWQIIICNHTIYINKHYPNLRQTNFR